MIVVDLNSGLEGDELADRRLRGSPGGACSVMGGGLSAHGFADRETEAVTPRSPEETGDPTGYDAVRRTFLTGSAMTYTGLGS